MRNALSLPNTTQNVLFSFFFFEGERVLCGHRLHWNERSFIRQQTLKNVVVAAAKPWERICLWEVKKSNTTQQAMLTAQNCINPSCTKHWNKIWFLVAFCKRNVVILCCKSHVCIFWTEVTLKLEKRVDATLWRHMAQWRHVFTWHEKKIYIFQDVPRAQFQFVLATTD